MQESGLAPNQVVQVRGFADQRLRKPDAPNDASNRRVSIIVKYQQPDKEESGQQKAFSPQQSAFSFFS
jgi:chemotaxis protein MotB